jgi:hypothetical protein
MKGRFPRNLRKCLDSPSLSPHSRLRAGCVCCVKSGVLVLWPWHPFAMKLNALPVVSFVHRRLCILDIVRGHSLRTPLASSEMRSLPKLIGQ